MTLRELAARSRAQRRLQAYSRRWRVARDNEDAYDWLQAYVRRMRVIDRRAPFYEPPIVTPAGNLHDLLQWVPRIGSS